MARYLIPPKTKRDTTFIKNITFKDIIVFGIGIVLAALAVSANMPVIKWLLVVVILLFSLVLCLKWGKYHKGYEWAPIIFNYVTSKKKYTQAQISDLYNFKNENGVVELYGNYAGVLEIAPIEFLLYSQQKQENVISKFAFALRYISKGSIVKIERPIDYGSYIERYKKRYKEITQEKNSYIEKLKAALGNAYNEDELNLAEFNSRLQIIQENIKFLEFANTEKKINTEVFYFVFYDKDKTSLENIINDTSEKFSGLGLVPKRLTSSEVTTFLQYFVYKEEKTPGSFELPAVTVDKNFLKLGEEKWNIATIGEYPVFAEGNAWAYSLFSVPGTNVVINFGNAEKDKVVKSVDKTIQELKYRYLNEKYASGHQDLEIQVQSLMTLLQQFKLGNESIHNVNVYVMYKNEQAQAVTQAFAGGGFMLNRLKFRQFEAFASMLPFVSKELLPGFSRHIQSATLAAAFPFVNNLFMDKEGDYLGDFRYPIFWDMWERGQHRVNSNLFEVGQSGNGKTVTLKKLLMQQRLRGVKVFALDCEGEYSYMAQMLGGQTVEMSGGSKINPFQIYPSVNTEGVKTVGEVSQQCAFLSEWFKVILPLDYDTKAILNNFIAQMYSDAKITDETDLSKLKDKDYPTFDTLIKLTEKKAKLSTNAAEKPAAQRLLIRLQEFTKNGIYSSLWNGTTTLDINNDFIVFDFQQLFANSNTEICNAQMQLLMRMLMREVIKVQKTNESTGSSNRVIVLVDEAHRYISKQFPVALDTLEQFARRIRKYDGAIIIATQNIDDFIGTSEEMKAKASAIINNCQYSMLFGLKADDVNKVQQLYAQYGGGLTPEEINFLSTAQRGQALFLVEPEKRSVVNVGLMPGEWPYIEKPKPKNLETNPAEDPTAA